MPNPTTDTKKPSRPARRGHFLTQRDVDYLLEGPEPKQKTKRIYTGKRIERERRAYKVAYARVVRESMRDARGALEDLAFLARVMGPEWLYDTVTEKRPLHEPTADEVPEGVQRDMLMLLGREEAPLEEFLRRVVGEIGWEKWPVARVEGGERVATERRGPFVAVRLLGAIERGLNMGEEKPSHQVSIVTRQGIEEAGGVGLFSGLTRVRRG